VNCLTSVWRTLLPVTILMLTAACATSPTGRMQLMLVSPEAAIVESQKAYLATMDQLAREDRLSSDRAVATRVGEITGRIVTIAEERFPGSRSWAWSVAIIDDPETVNAWCMAGGRMAVYTGLLQQLNLTDDELAHIMGHEVAHALANHTAEQMSRALATNIGLAVVDATVDPSQLGLSGAALAAQLALQG
jgi:Zn-dependent protease with chaperone function